MRYLLFLCLLGLFGCNDDPSKATIDTPEQVALGFFQAIYVDKDVEKATHYVDDPMKEVLKSYYIAASVQRHMLNLQMTDVTLEIEEIDIDFFRKFTDDVTVVVKFTGRRGGRPWVDDRTIRLHKRGRAWVIVEILPETGKINSGSL
ncbi:hypothetical protein [Shewanella algae]|uniref:hypothetical protein n=1 Tax=Shewanella algae TaxID=38313 RepID=UPI000B8B56AF|nr:hypothetical protein [Shewanella algae]OXR99973.1 hypothetical protein AMR44_14985 [Shewanella algae]